MRADVMHREYKPQSVIRTHLLRFIIIDMLPCCFSQIVPTSALPLHLYVTRYVFNETAAHLLNNRTKSLNDSNDLEIKEFR